MAGQSHEIQIILAVQLPSSWVDLSDWLDYYQSPTDTGYALLTYLYSRSISRFTFAPNTYSRIIQCAEALYIAPSVLRSTYTSAAWQDALLFHLLKQTSGRR